MFAHVTTYRLGSEAEVRSDMSSPDVISDQTARTIASWWHSPADNSRNITSLSHGLPFDTEGLREEIERHITEDQEATALLEWLDQLEAILAH